MDFIALLRRIVIHQTTAYTDRLPLERDIQMEDGAFLFVAALAVFYMRLITHHIGHRPVLVPRLGAEVHHRMLAKCVVFRIRCAADGLARELSFLLALLPEVGIVRLANIVVVS